MKKTLIYGLVFLILISSVLGAYWDTDANLLVWYECENDATDSGPNGYDGSVVGSASYSNTGGIDNYFCNFNDVWGLKRDTDIIINSGEFTATMWYKWGIETGTLYIMYLDYGGDANRMVVRRLTGTTYLDAWTYDGTNTDHFDTSNDYDNGNWHFLVFKRNSTAAASIVYDSGCNLLEENTNTDHPTMDITGTATNNLKLGFDGTTDYTPISIDDFRLYTRELTGAEIEGLCDFTYNAEVTNTPSVTLTTDIIDGDKIGFLDFSDGLYKFNINATSINNSNIYDVKLYINETLNITYSSVNLSDNHQYTYDFNNIEKAINFTVVVENENASDSSINYLYFDGINPEISVLGLTNHSTYFKNNTAYYIAFNASFADNNLIAANISINDAASSLIWQYENTSIPETLFNYAQTVDLNTNATGEYSIKFEAWDSHTAKEISNYKIIDKTFLSKKAYEIEDDLYIFGDDINKIDFIKAADRYSFDIDFKKKNPAIEIYAPDLQYLENSKYSAHFISLSLNKWIDFVNDGPQQDYTVKKLGQGHYKIIMLSDIQKLKYKSIGDLNYKETTYFFNISESFYLTAQDSETNTSITSFNATVFNSTDIYYFSTTDGSIELNISWGNYSINYTSDNFLTSQYFNISVYEGGSHLGRLNVSNAFKVYIRDQESLNLINQYVGLEFIGDLTAKNYSTTTGVKYITDLPPEDYIIRYASSGYSNAFYYFTLQNDTNVEFTIYMLNNETTDDVTASVIDDLNDPVEQAYIHVQRYDLNTNNYITVEIIATNFEGAAVLHLQKNTEFYKFLIYYDGVLKKSTEPTYVYEDTITFQIQLGEDIAADFYTWQNVYYSLTYNTATENFKYIFSDDSATITAGTLYLYNVTNNTEQLLSSSSVSAASGTILLNAANASGTTYRADAYVTFNGQENYIVSAYYSYPKERLEEDKTAFFLIIFLMLLFALFAYWDAALAVFMVPLPLVLGSFLHLIKLPWFVTLPIEIVAIMVSVIITKSRGAA